MVLYGNLDDFLAILATSGWEKPLDFENYFIKVGSYKKNEGFTNFVQDEVLILWQSHILPSSLIFRVNWYVFAIF